MRQKEGRALCVARRRDKEDCSSYWPQTLKCTLSIWRSHDKSDYLTGYDCVLSLMHEGALPALLCWASFPSDFLTAFCTDLCVLSLMTTSHDKRGCFQILNTAKFKQDVFLFTWFVWHGIKKCNKFTVILWASIKGFQENSEQVSLKLKGWLSQQYGEGLF